MRRRRSLALLAVLVVCSVLLPATAQATDDREPAAPAEAVPRIVGGTQADPGEYPYQVAIYPKAWGRVNYCGGSLIHPRWVLTAAHCVEGATASVFRILVGTNDLLLGGEEVDPDLLIIHPGWNNTTNQNDLALFRLSRPVSSPLANLVRSGQGALWAPGDSSTVTGWGATSEGGLSARYLREVTVPIIADSTCTANYLGWFIEHDPATMVCAGVPAGGIDSCQGDSGGPLAVDAPSTHRIQVGVVSWGDGCARAGRPGVYTRLAAYFDWIRTQTGRPPNDDFASAATPACGVAAFTEANQFATGQTGEPQHVAGSPAGGSVWYRYTAPTSGTLHLNTFGSDIDTLLAAYTGGAVNALSPVASNDDAAGPDDRRSAVSFPVTGGTTYRIAVDGYWQPVDGTANDRGRVRLNLAFEPAAGTQFPDVPRSSQFYDEVEWMASTGITTGFADCGFRPGDPVSRQSMAAFLYRLAGWDLAFHPAPGFTDVPGGHPFYGEIAWMVDEGITTGFPDGSYRTTAPVTRQSMAAFLYRLAGSPRGSSPTCATAPFPDVPTGHPFCGEIDWMVDEGITAGFPDGGFHPADAVSRQAMAAFMQRYADR